MPRLTPIRKEVLHLLSSHHLLTASDLLLHVKKTHSQANKTTVYRALEFLTEENLLCKHTFGSTEACYELREHHHDHCVCTSCGMIAFTHCAVHVSPSLPGFTVNHHHATFYGVCARCQQSKES